MTLARARMAVKHLNLSGHTMNEVTPTQPIMSALAISMVKNEADIIEASIRHNLKYLDLFVVIDNGSVDGTRGILEALRAEGLPILIFEDFQFGHFQSEKITEVYRRVVPIYQPDLVYLLDADEFIRSPSRGSLEATLAAVPPGTTALLPWCTHIPDPAKSQRQILEDPLGSCPWRRKTEDPVYYKAVVRRDPQQDHMLIIEQGNHGVSLLGGRRVDHFAITGASLAHLPVRSAAQISAKVINGWHALMIRNRSRNVPGEAYQWRDIYDQIISGTTIEPQNVADIALRYAQSNANNKSMVEDAVRDPTASRYGVLKYLDVGRHDPLAKVALTIAKHIETENRVVVTHEKTSSPGLDLAAVKDLISQVHARRISVVEDTPLWSRAVSKHLPELEVTAVHLADVVIAPAVSVADGESLPMAVRPELRRRVVTWLPADHTSEDLAAFLSRWSRAGWEPEMQQTMSMRALAAFMVVRRGALVLRPREAGQPERAIRVRDALISIARNKLTGSEPEPQVMMTPLQHLHLGQPNVINGHQPSSTASANLFVTPAPALARTEGALRVAVITPYYKEPSAWLERCLASVRAQSHSCTHIVVSDGHPQDWIESAGVRHLRLDQSHADYGNTPRSIGAQLAVAEGFDAIAFLDADNWYLPDHVERCIAQAKEAKADYVVSQRLFVREDGSVIPFVSREDESGQHIDTSCFLILKGAFHTLPRWLLMPKPMSMLGDRYYLKSLRDEGLIECRTNAKTVLYLCGWSDVYRAIGESPPTFAKGSLPLASVRRWIDELSPEDSVLVKRLSGCDVDRRCRVLAQCGI